MHQAARNKVNANVAVVCAAFVIGNCLLTLAILIINVVFFLLVALPLKNLEVQI